LLGKKHPRESNSVILKLLQELAGEFGMQVEERGWKAALGEQQSRCVVLNASRDKTERVVSTSNRVHALHDAYSSSLEHFYPHSLLPSRPTGRRIREKAARDPTASGVGLKPQRS